MAKKSKHQFHCEKCSSPCNIYRKGKKHRVLVCPVCGVLATNPFSLKRAFTGATTGAALGAPVAGIGAIPGAIAGGLIGAFSGGDEAPPPHTQQIAAFPHYKRWHPDRITQALAIR